MNGRIAVFLDPGLGWTKPLFMACCRGCGTELARHPHQMVAVGAAGRRRCPVCGTRTARRLPGTQPSCMGPQAPAQLLPERTPGSGARPWSDSTLPIPASTDHWTR